MFTEPPSFLQAALDAAPAPTTQLMQPAARPARRGRVSAALPGERRKPGAGTGDGWPGHPELWWSCSGGAVAGWAAVLAAEAGAAGHRNPL